MRAGCDQFLRTLKNCRGALGTIVTGDGRGLVDHEPARLAARRIRPTVVILSPVCLMTRAVQTEPRSPLRKQLSRQPSGFSAPKFKGFRLPYLGGYDCLDGVWMGCLRQRRTDLDSIELRRQPPSSSCPSTGRWSGAASW